MVNDILKIILKLPVNEGLLKFMHTKVGYNCHSNAILANIWSENTTILVQSSIVHLDILLHSIESKFFFSHKRYIHYIISPKNLELNQNLLKNK